MSGEPPTDDPYLQTLGMIASELAAIRQELQRLNHQPEDDRPRFECRSCEAVVAGEDNARAHAQQEHGAPADDWRTLMDPHERDE